MGLFSCFGICGSDAVTPTPPSAPPAPRIDTGIPSARAAIQAISPSNAPPLQPLAATHHATTSSGGSSAAGTARNSLVSPSKIIPAASPESQGVHFFDIHSTDPELLKLQRMALVKDHFPDLECSPVSVARYEIKVEKFKANHKGREVNLIRIRIVDGEDIHLAIVDDLKKPNKKY